MKSKFKFLLATVFLSLIYVPSLLSTPSGFYLPDSLRQVTLHYKSIENLIILPAIINDSIEVNLILDTGCRNLILFGQRFQSLLQVQPEKKVQFSGLGNGEPVYGSLSINNRVSINEVLGDKIPVVLVPDENLFQNYPNVHGVVGYDIFLKFEIEINPNLHLITFRPAMSSILPCGYTSIPLCIEDSRPILTAEIFIRNTPSQRYKLMIDTGSTLGLLLKTADLTTYPKAKHKTILGRGFNGNIEGIRTITKRLVLGRIEILNVNTGIMHSPWHSYASIGMGGLKHYSIILNYCKAYAGLKKLAQVTL